MKRWSERVVNLNIFLTRIAFRKIVGRNLSRSEAKHYAFGFLPSESIKKFTKIKKKIPLPDDSENLNKITDTLAQAESVKNQERDGLFEDNGKLTSLKIPSLISKGIEILKYQYSVRQMRKEAVREIKKMRKRTEKDSIKEREAHFNKLSEGISGKIFEFQLKYNIEIKKKKVLAEIIKELPREHRAAAKKYFESNDI